MPTADALFNKAWGLATAYAEQWWREARKGRAIDPVEAYLDGLIHGHAQTLEEHPSYLGAAS